MLWHKREMVKFFEGGRRESIANLGFSMIFQVFLGLRLEVLREEDEGERTSAQYRTFVHCWIWGKRMEDEGWKGMKV